MKAEMSAQLKGFLGRTRKGLWDSLRVDGLSSPGIFLLETFSAKHVGVV